MSTTTLPHMLSTEMASIARAHSRKPTIGELVLDAQSAIERAQRLLVDHPQDPNATILELNEAWGLLETIDKSFTIGTLDTPFGE